MNDTFHDACMRTKSDIYTPEKMPDSVLLRTLREVQHAGEQARLLKKAVFQGKDQWPVETVQQDKTQADLSRIPPEVLHGVLGKINELGELVSALLPAIFNGQSINWANFHEELFDDDWFTEMCLEGTGETREMIRKRGLHKLRIRYPDKFDPAMMDDENRNKDAERAALEG